MNCWYCGSLRDGWVGEEDKGWGMGVVRLLLLSFTWVFSDNDDNDDDGGAMALFSAVFFCSIKRLHVQSRHGFLVVEMMGGDEARLLDCAPIVVVGVMMVVGIVWGSGG